MEYRVIEILERDGKKHEIERKVFDSAYQALDFMAQSWFYGEECADRLYLIDSEGTVLLTPAELFRGAPMRSAR